MKNKKKVGNPDMNRIGLPLYRAVKCSGADSAKCGMVCVADLGVLPRYYSQTASLPLSLCASVSVALLLAQVVLPL